jgi:septal ring factor EnvC (AmiA/AmiB activator)
MARRPPVLALLQPGSVRDIVHVHAVLASVMPLVRARTAELRTDVERGRVLRVAADAALAAERTAQARLITQRQQLVALEARKRIDSSRFASSALTEQDRAIAMGEEARDITELMSGIDSATAVRARLEALPGPILRPAEPSAARSLPTDTAVATASIPAYRLPVVGQVVTGLGEISEAGVRARGLTIATRPGAQVVAPTSGRIAFAGPFRGYGNIVVIDHGLGWTSLLTSLAALDVKVGDNVDAGAPIGRAGTDRPTITVELRRRGTPVDIAKLAG